VRLFSLWFGISTPYLATSVSAFPFKNVLNSNLWQLMLARLSDFSMKAPDPLEQRPGRYSPVISMPKRQLCQKSWAEFFSEFWKQLYQRLTISSIPTPAIARKLLSTYQTRFIL
jgi:hypothetical protein